MAKILEGYKRNKEGMLEETYTLINMQGEEFTSVEKEDYSIEREKELLNELRKCMFEKIYNYSNLYMLNYKEMERITTGLVMTGMSAINNYGVAGTLTALYSLQTAKVFIKRYKEMKKIEKFVFYIDNEEDFKNFNDHLGFAKSKLLDRNINKKITEMCMNGEDLDCNNISRFSKRQLTKIKKFTNKVL